MMLNLLPSCAVYFCRFAIICPAAVAVVQDLAPESAPDLLTFDELLQLSETAEPEGALAERLHRLLYTPFVSNQAASRGARPKRPVREPIGPVVRATMWNIERGSEFDLIRLAFSDPDAFIESVNQRVVLDPISDHHPIMVDLPFQAPPPLAGTGERRRKQPAEISSGPVGGEGGP